MRKPLEIDWNAKYVKSFSKDQFIKDHEATYPDNDLAAVWDKYNPEPEKEAKKK